MSDKKSNQNPSPDYSEFARMMYATGVVSDPWLGGGERFRLQAVTLEPPVAAALGLAAENIGVIYDELTRIVLQDPVLLDEFFGLTPWQKAMWLSSAGRWHGISRVDLFICRDGRIRACEMNSDTPSGEAEAVLLNRILHPFHPHTRDPNSDLEERFWRMLCNSHRARLKRKGTMAGSDPEKIAIIYPTDLPEDLSMIAIYKEWLESRGCIVILGSPFNLGLDPEKRLTVFGEPVDLIIRHYKTDWWGEREPVWTNQAAFPDPDPLERELLLLLEADFNAEVTVVNPFGAVITQNKKSMALMWERRELFSSSTLDLIDEYIPETRRLIAIDQNGMSRKEWVLKSDYGCEGDSVVCGPLVKAREWKMFLASAVPERWIAQKFFEIDPLEDALLPNYGVYLIGGEAAGFYTRLSVDVTDYTSVTAPTYIASSKREERKTKQTKITKQTKTE